MLAPHAVLYTKIHSIYQLNPKSYKIVYNTSSPTNKGICAVTIHCTYALVALTRQIVHQYICHTHYKCETKHGLIAISSFFLVFLLSIKVIHNHLSMLTHRAIPFLKENLVIGFSPNTFGSIIQESQICPWISGESWSLRHYSFIFSSNILGVPLVYRAVHPEVFGEKFEDRAPHASIEAKGLIKHIGWNIKDVSLFK